MRLMRYSTGVALAALLAGSAVAQAHPAAAPQNPPAAATLDPAAEEAPTRAVAAQPQFRIQDGIVATVNDAIITSFDLRQRMLILIAMTQVQPTEQNLPAIQQQALESLIEQRLRAAEISKFETLRISDEEVNAELTEMAAQAGTNLEGYLDFYRGIGVQPQVLREQLRTEIGWGALVRGRFQDRAKVSAAQVEQAMRQLSESAAKPQYLIGEIYIEAARVGGQQAAMNGAQQLIQQIVQGAPFQAVARQFSAAPSAMAQVPGDAGWVVQGTVQPALQAAFDQLDAGQLSNPIPVDGGVYIIYMRDKRAGAATSLVQMKQVMVEVAQDASEAQVAAATQRLEALRPQLTCDNIIQASRQQDGMTGADLGESDVADLAPQFQQVARSAEIGTISNAVRTPLGVHLLAVCGRRVGGPEAPTQRQVEARLQNQQYGMLDRRYTRDLRQSALIEMK